MKHISEKMSGVRRIPICLNWRRGCAKNEDRECDLHHPDRWPGSDIVLAPEDLLPIQERRLILTTKIERTEMKLEFLQTALDKLK